MKPYLAEQLLVKLMGWDTDRVSKERPWLQAMASYKLDEYQQFAPGVRFTESLVNWLDQFDTTDEKETAYSFVINQLVFFSNNQLCRLIDICYSTHVQPIISRKTANQLDIKPYDLSTIIKSDIYQQYKRTSIFIGLSDGARMDYFRRASRVNNEQVLLTYSVSEDKISDMVQELNKTYENGTFTTIFLIDDFTASGRSFIRKQNDSYTGKIIKTISYLLINPDRPNPLVQIDQFDLHILFYVATSSAIQYIDEELSRWKVSQNMNFIHSVKAVQELPDVFNKPVLADQALMNLCEKYFDPTIVDRHFEQGNNERPFLGFNEGALPLVLNHNTPNNSLPILWLPEDKEYHGLFPRVSRHN